MRSGRGVRAVIVTAAAGVWALGCPGALAQATAPPAAPQDAPTQAQPQIMHGGPVRDPNAPKLVPPLPQAPLAAPAAAPAQAPPAGTATAPAPTTASGPSSSATAPASQAAAPPPTAEPSGIVPLPSETPAAASAAPVLIYPPGAWVYGNWKAWFVGTHTDLIYVRNTSVDEPVSAVQLPFAQPTILRRLLTFNFRDFMQFGEQPALEKALDAACALHAKDPSKMPERTVESVSKELLGDAAQTVLSHPDKDTPYFVGSTMSALAKPERVESALAPQTFQVMAAVASCKEPDGKRFHLAQKRGFETLVANNIHALTWLIERYISDKAPGAASEEERDKLKAQALSISIKAIKLAQARMRDYQSWLAGPEGKELGGRIVWDAPMAPRAQAYARGLTAMLTKELLSLTKEYDAGTVRNKEIYPVIEETVTLSDDDLGILFHSS